MRKRLAVLALLCAVPAVPAAQTTDPIGAAVEAYFTAVFSQLGKVAAQNPTRATFREAMKPAAESVDGFFGGTLINADFVIIQSYYKIHALANGTDLKKIRQLDYFWRLMRTAPGPQLSEPGHGSILQPRLISMRYPILTDGRLQGIVSIMIRTENFMQAVGLDQCRAYQIVCRGELAETKGTLSGQHREVALALPSTEWVIRYDP
jgi:hypothetical protein